MKKRLKILGIVTLLTLSIFLTIPKGVFAWVTKGEQISSTNLITLPWHPGTPNLYWRFSFSDTGQVVYCIEPHVVFNGGHSYGYLGKYSAATGKGSDIGRQISYVYSANIGLSDNENHQIKQAVIWALNGDYDIYGLDRNNWYVNRAIQLYEEAKNNASGIDIYNQMSTHDLYFNLEGTNWVSNWVYIKPGSSVWSNIGWLQRDGDNWRLVVDNGSLSSAVDTYIYSSMTTTIYDEADVFDGPNNSSSNGQTVAVGGSSYQNSNGEQAYGRITPVGNLVVEKKDNYGTYRQGATFHVTGPGGTWDVTTGNDGKAYLNNILIGSYQITETQAPNNMKNEEENRTNSVNVSAGQTVTYTRTNGYPTGSVRLGKYDADHRNSTLGNATLKGAKYNLCAAEDIYEGATLRYSNGQVIREVETDEYGNTPAITGLPVGNYYYIETQASTGFLKNSDRVPVSINYVNQYTYVIGESYVETAEKPSYSNLKIHKRLGATDYDNEIDLSGVQFKVTLKSDSSQVYYTSVSGADGICTLNNIPYGTYIVSENKLNDAGYKIADFEVFCGENGKTYEYTKVDESKKMKIEVNKEILLHEGEATDAVVSGAVFTVYRDAACTNKVCEIGTTNENGYAISGTMRTGTYYMKETEFPVGINPDTTIPGENVTYRNKVYTVSSDNKVQGPGIVTVPTTIQNEPKRGTIEIIKKLGVTDYDAISNLEGAQFRATLISNPTCYFDSNPTSSDGKCTISDIPYGEYVVEEIVVPDSAYKIENFQVMIEEQGKKYSYTKVDESKKMKIEVNKEILLHEGEAT
ncbi:MAG: SpaA isopeptide-forming pilin-related protein, partial [Clostridia bacterium]